MSGGYPAAAPAGPGADRWVLIVLGAKESTVSKSEQRAPAAVNWLLGFLFCADEQPVEAS